MIDIIIAIVLIIAMFLVGGIILLKEIAEAFNLKDNLILIRCDKEEKEQIKRDAEEHGKTISDFIRYLVAKERKEKSNG